jgi:hypoxanthine phosphoribosyltransferase
MNDKIIINGKKFKKHIDKSEIEIAVSKIAEKINKDYLGKSPTFLVILKGALPFAADLIRRVNLPCDLEVMSAKSYGTGISSSGDVKLADFGAKFNGKDIIIVEDIVDTGLTLKALFNNILVHKPASLATAAILSKPDSRLVDVELKYTGIEIPPYFVVGYGLDYAEYGRNLPDIYILDESID